MIHTEREPGLDGELRHRVDTLARLVRSAPRFTDALRWWGGFDLRREPREPDSAHVLDERDALLLDLPPGTDVTRREGYLVSAGGGTVIRVAEVSALIHTAGMNLDLDQKAALREGTTPLGQVLHGAQRATHYAVRVGGPPVDDHAALRSRATLLRAGRPIALVRETVLWKLITHRAPGDLPSYVQAPSRLGAAS
jgi:hypothetical protein